MQDKILVTGANGFVGCHFCRFLKEQNTLFRAVVRKGSTMPIAVDDLAVVKTIGKYTDWHDALQGISHIVHFAAANDLPGMSEDLHQEVNYYGSLHLAQQAQEHNIARMIFLSSIKVHGETTEVGQAFQATDVTAPLTAYARSKDMAEKVLLELADKSDMDVTVIRPPVIYGLGSKGSIARLAKAILYGLPLPFASLKNSRSILSIPNVCSFIYLCLTHPAAKNTVALISDGEDVSTPQLTRYIASALHRKAHLFHCSPHILKPLLSLARVGYLYPGLCCNLQVDISQHKEIFGWTPKVSVQQAMSDSFK